MKKASFFHHKTFLHFVILLFITLIPLVSLITFFKSRDTLFQIEHHVSTGEHLSVRATHPPPIPIPSFQLMYYRNLLSIIITPLLYLFNISILIPYLLVRGKVGWYLIGILLTITGIAFIHYLATTYLMTFDFFENLPQEVKKIEQNSWYLPFAILPPVLILAVSTSVEITSEWIKQINKQKAIEHEKTLSELAYLKSQINPHFLFNTLNNIYSLASEKSDETETAILKLSQLMRYTLYEADTENISLENEVEHLENYIELQKLRISAKRNIQITFQKKGDFKNRSIAPLLLIPFVENAFKYGVSYMDKCEIIFYLSMEDNILVFKAKNSKNTDNFSFQNHDSKGIGLANVKRRLDLLYPSLYLLDIKDVEHSFQITLKLTLL